MRVTTATDPASRFRLMTGRGNTVRERIECAHPEIEPHRGHRGDHQPGPRAESRGEGSPASTFTSTPTPIVIFRKPQNRKVEIPMPLPHENLDLYHFALPNGVIGSLVLLLLSIIGCAPIANRVAFKPDPNCNCSHLVASPDVRQIRLVHSDSTYLNGLFLPSHDTTRMLLYFQGQGSCCCHIGDFLLDLRECGTSVLTVDYRGTGLSSGRATEDNAYEDAELAFRFAIDSLGVSAERIVVMGRSLGTTVATHLAGTQSVGGLILVQPLTSGKDFIKVHFLSLFAPFAGRSFDNISRIDSIKSPLLIIHGTEDEVFPFWMAERLFSNAGPPKQLVRVAGANHENIYSLDAGVVLSSVSRFLNDRVRMSPLD